MLLLGLTLIEFLQQCIRVVVVTSLARPRKGAGRSAVGESERRVSVLIEHQSRPLTHHKAGTTAILECGEARVRQLVKVILGNVIILAKLV